MHETAALQALFRYNAWANEEILKAMKLFDDSSPAKEIAIRTLNHTYIVDQIFAANNETNWARVLFGQHKPCADVATIVSSDQNKRPVVH